MPTTEIPSKLQGQVQLDLDVEGDWCLVDASSARVPSPGRAINLNNIGQDNTDLETMGQSYLDDQEDFRGYRVEEEKDTLDKIGGWFRRSSTMIKKKWDDTDIKGGASDLGKSIKNTSSKAGDAIKESFKEENVTRKREAVKRGWFSFKSKVKGIFSSSGDEETKTQPEEEKRQDPKSAKHDDMKATLKGSDSDDDVVPEMLKLEGQSDSDENEDQNHQLKGQAQVVFGKGVVRDFRESEKADALDEDADTDEEADNLL